MPHDLMNDKEFRNSDPDPVKLEQALTLVRTDFGGARSMFGLHPV
jgi:hypothetical protein